MMKKQTIIILCIVLFCGCDKKESVTEAEYLINVDINRAKFLS
jgi:hypothetical protein